MIKGNTLDLFKVYLVDGDSFFLIARDEEHAFSLAQYYFPSSSIASVQTVES